MCHQTREYDESTYSVISLSMLRLGQMEKYRQTILPALVRSPEAGVGRQPIPHFNQIELRAQWISLEVSAREEQLLTSNPRAADRPLPGEIRLGLHTRPRPSSEYDPEVRCRGCSRRTTPSA
jgi:hypothetical protein